MTCWTWSTSTRREIRPKRLPLTELQRNANLSMYFFTNVFLACRRRTVVGGGLSRWLGLHASRQVHQRAQDSQV